jgi:hypothetical protein
MRTVFTLSLLTLCACGNLAPGPAIITLSPANPTTSDDITVSIDTDALDPEGKELEYRYHWYRDGERVPDASGQTLSAALTAKGERWRVEVVASDGKAEGAAIGAEVSIGNSAPRVTIHLDPGEPLSSDDLVVTAERFDADGDTVGLDFSWTRDGQPTGHSGDTVPAADTGRFQVWEVTVVPSDGELQGEPAVASVSIANTPPEVTSLTISPTTAYEDDVIRVQASFDDADNDSINVVYAWYVDGSLTLEGSATTMSGAYFDKHQQIVVEVTPSDSLDVGETVRTETVSVLNSLPTASSVSIEPSELFEGSVASCVVEGLEDVDGDEITSVITWTVNGATASHDETIDGGVFSRGDTVSCALDTHDGEDDGPTLVSSTLTVQNSLPVIASVSTSPDPAYEGDTLSATLTGTVDDDGDAVSLAYAWYVDGSLVSSASSLSSALFDKHDEVVVEVTPHDGRSPGLPVGSAPLTISNSPPSFTSLELSSDEASFGGSLTAYPSGWSDADGDPEGYLYAWYGAGSVVGTGATLDLNLVRVGAEVYCEVSAYDGDDVGTTLTSELLTIQHQLSATAADMVLRGNVGEELGQAVGLGGDLTGDGFPDLALGAPAADQGGADSGVLYVVTRPIAGNYAIGTRAVATLWGDPAAEVGASLSFAGDVDGDGVADLVVGAPGVSIFGAEAGAAYVLPGPFSGSRSIVGVGFEFLGSGDGARAGAAVRGAGDLDADGFDDVVVGAHGADSEAGAAYIAYGPISAGGILDYVDVELTGEAAGDQAGSSVAGAGDFDGDGFDDLLIGALGESSVGSATGAVYLVFGPPAGSGSLGSLADLKLIGEGAFDYVGHAVDGVGDTDGDGLDDIVVTARWEDGGGSSSGAAYLVLGGLSGTMGLASADAKFVGTAANEQAGSAVAGIGDFDGDSLSDLLIGAEGGALGGASSGQVYMLQGPLSGTLDLDDAADLIVEGAGAGDELGRGVCGGGDVDRDGQGDIILGAPYENTNGSAAGAVYLFFGSSL